MHRDNTLDYIDIDPITRYPQNFSGKVGGKDPGDAFRFEASDVTRVVGKLDVLRGDADLQLWRWVDGNNDELIATSSNDDRNSEHLSVQVASGQYYWQVFSANGGIARYELAAYAEPPEPFTNDMGNSAVMAWDMGTRNSLSDGIIWNNGITEIFGSSGISLINESIGGDDVTDFATFVLGQSANLRLTTNNAIVEILNDTASSVIASSNDGYSSIINVALQPGRYYLHYSSEGSIAEQFTSEIYLT